MDCIAAALEFLMRETLARHGLTAEITITKINQGESEACGTCGPRPGTGTPSGRRSPP